VTPDLRCQDVAGSIEAIAAGELELARPGAGEHVRTCDACQRRVALARRLEGVLSAATVPVPEGFTPRVVKRVRDENRRRERVVDWVFNLAVFGGGVAALAAVAVLLQWTGVSALAGSMVSLAGQGVARAASGAAVDSFLYIAGSLAGLTAFLMWRWSEGERFL
jgi:anti-sigma factor RsiW